MILATTITIELEFKEEAVTIKDKSGNTTEFKIREMSGALRDKWMNTMGSRLKSDANGKPIGMRDFTGIQSSLIALCLFDSAGNSIPENTIAAWPASAQKALFEICQKINGMDEASAEAEKNS